MKYTQTTSQSNIQSARSPLPYSFKSSSATQNSVRKHVLFDRLRELGVSRYGLMQSEFSELVHVLHPSEQVMGVVYGRAKEGFAVLVATNRRILFLDKKPMFLHADEVAYQLVGGVTYGNVGLLSTVTLHTRLGDYTLKTMNAKATQLFISYIENRCLERLNSRKDDYDQFNN